MPCYFPLTGFKAATTNKNGKRPLSFSTAGFRDLPVEVPCGQCIGCRLERSRQWAVRLMHERSCHDLAVFLTLTYDQAHLPPGGTLVPRHFNLFVKRLRKFHKHKIKYFHCGEYGDDLSRPHYHAIIFGLDFADKKKHSISPQGDTLYTSETLTKLWGYGHCLIGQVSFKSARYVASYCVKKVNGEKANAHYSRPDADGVIHQLHPEYATQSNGLGLTWIKRFYSDVFPVDRVVCEGRESSVPRYYRKKLAEYDEKNLPAPRYGRSLSKRLSDERIKSAKKRASDNTPERLVVKHTVRLSKISQLKRTI